MLNMNMKMDFEKAKVRALTVVRSRVFQRVATIAIAFGLALGFIIATVRLATSTHIIPKVLSHLVPRIPQCKLPTANTTDENWIKYKEKYDHLSADNFTIAIQTYQRPKELNDTLNILLSADIPSLTEIVIVWNDQEEKPPADFVSKFGLPVRYRHSEANSLNMRLHPDPSYKTQAILLSDDDVYYHPKDLEFVFQAWRKWGRYRMTGALGRCSEVDAYGNWGYNFCNNDEGTDHYSMVLTNLAFSHISFMEYYSSNDTLPNAIREYVDEGFNCEDIAMNYLASYLTGEGPLIVKGRENYVNYYPKKGISTKPGHLEARSKCLNDFAKMFGCMPLINEDGYIKRGVGFQ